MLLRTDRQTDIWTSRAAFAAENSKIDDTAIWVEVEHLVTIGTKYIENNKFEEGHNSQPY